MSAHALAVRRVVRVVSAGTAALGAAVAQDGDRVVAAVADLNPAECAELRRALGRVLDVLGAAS